MAEETWRHVRELDDGFRLTDEITITIHEDGKVHVPYKALDRLLRLTGYRRDGECDICGEVPCGSIVHCASSR